MKNNTLLAYASNDDVMREQRAYIDSANFIVMPVRYSQLLAILVKEQRSKTPQYELSYEIITALRFRYSGSVNHDLADRQLCLFVRAQYESDIETMNRKFSEELERCDSIIEALRRNTIRFINILEIANARLYGIKLDTFALTQLEDVPVSALGTLQREQLPRYAANFFYTKQLYTNYVLQTEKLPEINAFSEPQLIEQRIRESGGYLDPITAQEYCNFLKL